ncbi:MAG: DUF4931 domain-containing protein [Nanoarchaeota archaeon]|nr:DUF4931 domain-containing protein [Nanoarchaeota archaeon]
MGIIRKDYILDRWVYYAAERKKRPRDFKSIEVKDNSKICFFCPWNAHMTPPEIGRVEYKNGWKMRWFLNKFPAVENKGKARLKSKKYFSESDSYGVHEVIVETQHHKSQLADLPASQIRELLEVYKVRIRELSKLKDIKYVDIFKNHGKDAGTSLAHSHTQVVALPQVPTLVRQESEAAKKYKKCPFCEIIRLESKTKRKIFETKNVIAFAPFASRFNYEAWIFTKQHKKTMEELEEYEFEDLAAALKKILVKLKKISASYNFYVHYSPEKENLHFHIEVTPRLATWGGFEISTDAVINSVLPEDAARFYRK